MFNKNKFKAWIKINRTYLVYVGVVIKSHTERPLDLIIIRLRVILKILWPYKDQHAEIEQKTDLINTHLSDLITTPEYMTL